MLSILIPEYNYDCTKLVYSLVNQCTNAGIPFEVIVMDDASTLFKTENRHINTWEGCSFVESKRNQGRARTRNELGKLAKYPYLLMIDCDAEVANNSYIQNYLDTLSKAQVIVGGVSYSSLKPETDTYLRWHYGKKRESLKADIRNLNPCQSLQSFNLMVEKEVMAKYPFDENFKDYGHEDSVMGYNLKQAGISILHIDNPLIHLGLDKNRDFLAKSLKAVEKYTNNPLFRDEALTGQIKIFRVYRKVETWGLCPLLAFKFRAARKLMEWNLCGSHPSLFLFDFYRLSYMCDYRLKQQSERK